MTGPSGERRIAEPPPDRSGPIDVRTAPERYRHWRLRVEGRIATLTLAVDESGGLAPGYELKLNSYDLGVDVELADAVQRLRFEHPEVAAVVIRSDRERVFCAGANIRMLGTSSHAHKVAFCKFTNETRCAIEDAGAYSGQRYLCAINGTAAGGGYELALAADWILLVDDGASAVSLPEVPLLGVLPGTGGLVRVVDKRKVRRDRADFFSTTEEGVRGARALEWGLVDEIAPSSRFEDAVAARARALAAASDRPAAARGIRLGEVARRIDGDRIACAHVEAEIDRERKVRACRIRLRGPAGPTPAGVEGLVEAGDAFWPLALARELEDLILHLRHNEPEIGTLVFTSEGALEAVAAHDAFLLAHRGHWLAREILLYWKRLLKRIALTSRSLVALVEPGSCFAGFLLELVLAADRAYMLDGPFGEDGDGSDGGDGRDRDGNGGSGGALEAAHLGDGDRNDGGDGGDGSRGAGGGRDGNGGSGGSRDGEGKGRDSGREDNGDGEGDGGSGREDGDDGERGGAVAAVRLTESNFGCFPCVNGLARLASRCLDDDRALARARQRIGRDLTAAEAEALRLATFTPDEIDWDDEVRLALEERAGFSPDALTGMEASLRCPGPETMESRIFGRLTAWQNWIFQRPNAVGERGALTLYGSGVRADFDRRRV